MDLIAIAMFVRCALMHVCISLILIFVCVVVVYVFSSCHKLGYMTYRTNRSWAGLLFGVSHCARCFWWSTGLRIYQGIPTRGLSFLHSSPVFGTLGTPFAPKVNDRWQWCGQHGMVSHASEIGGVKNTLKAGALETCGMGKNETKWNQKYLSKSYCTHSYLSELHYPFLQNW